MIISDDLIGPIANSFRSKKRKIILVGGCFDVLHDGHIEFLKKARALGDMLVLLLESDKNIKKLKGKERPKNTLKTRANNLEALGFIDFVVELSPLVSDKYYYNLTKLIKPDIIALTHSDPLTKIKNDQAKMVGGKTVEVMNRDERFSSTKIIKNK